MHDQALAAIVGAEADRGHARTSQLVERGGGCSTGRRRRCRRVDGIRKRLDRHLTTERTVCFEPDVARHRHHARVAARNLDRCRLRAAEVVEGGAADVAVGIGHGGDGEAHRIDRHEGIEGGHVRAGGRHVHRYEAERIVADGGDLHGAVRLPRPRNLRDIAGGVVLLVVVANRGQPRAVVGGVALDGVSGDEARRHAPDRQCVVLVAIDRIDDALWRAGRVAVRHRARRHGAQHAGLAAGRHGEGVVDAEVVVAAVVVVLVEDAQRPAVIVDIGDRGAHLHVAGRRRRCAATPPVGERGEREAVSGADVDLATVEAVLQRLDEVVRVDHLHAVPRRIGLRIDIGEHAGIDVVVGAGDSPAVGGEDVSEQRPRISAEAACEYGHVAGSSGAQIAAEALLGTSRWRELPARDRIEGRQRIVVGDRRRRYHLRIAGRASLLQRDRPRVRHHRKTLRGRVVEHVGAAVRVARLRQRASEAVRAAGFDRIDDDLRRGNDVVGEWIFFGRAVGDGRGRAIAVVDGAQAPRFRVTHRLAASELIHLDAAAADADEVGATVAVDVDEAHVGDRAAAVA